MADKSLTTPPTPEERANVAKKREARAAYWDRVTRETIKKHLDRGPHVCCMDKGEEMPKSFKRCIDCKALDNSPDL